MKREAYNPYLPSFEYIPDGEPYVFDGRVYIFGSHDRFNGLEYCMNDYVCWSAAEDDLGNWKYEGVIYKRYQDPLYKDTDGYYMYAPDVCRGKDGRFYLYYIFNRVSLISVAVCDTPAGEYKFYGHVKYQNGSMYGDAKGDVNNFDPGIFIDDDGKIYLYTGFAPRPGSWLHKLLKVYEKRIDGSYCVELDDDMLTVKTTPKMVLSGGDGFKNTSFRGHGFFEASSMRKINGIYYLIYSSVNGNELCYAVSSRPDGGFTFGGTIVSNGDIGFNGRTEPLNYVGNNHGSIAKINGQWYVFYHRQTNKHEYSRQACAERITITPDGKIPQVEITSCGLNNAPLKGKGIYEARIACNLSSGQGAGRIQRKYAKKHPYFTQSGQDREAEGDQYIANLSDGAWAGFKYFSIDSVKNISVKTRGKGFGKMLVFTDMEKTPAAEIDISPSKVWKDFSASINILGGRQALYFKYSGKDSIDFTSFCLT